MKYLEWIKQSKTYICPKSGVYKIICVGGGSSGGVTQNNSGLLLAHSGGTTSFGDLLSADGGVCAKMINKNDNTLGGQGGYDGINYAKPPFMLIGPSYLGFENATSFDTDTGHGYGAGGGAATVEVPYVLNSSSSKVVGRPSSGYCGKMESTILDLYEGQSIVCTVGKGGSNIFTNDEIKAFCYPTDPSKVTVTSESVSALASAVGSGADGVIIVQYIGESM